MTDLAALITNIELCSQVDGHSTVTFPTLKTLSVNDVVTVWSSVSKHVQEQLLQTKPPAVSVTGLGTFHIQKWLSFENGEVLTFQRPRFSLCRTLKQIRELQHSSLPVPDEMKRVKVTYKRILSDVPYPEEVVQNCMQETLSFMSFVLTNRDDVDFVLKDLGTLAIRGREVTMAFCEDFILRLNKSTYVAEKLLSRKWVVPEEDVALFPSNFGRVRQFPQFEIKTVPRRAVLRGQAVVKELERASSSMGATAAVDHILRLMRRGVSAESLARVQTEEEAEKKVERKGSPARLLSQQASTEELQHGTPLRSPRVSLLTCEEPRQTLQKGQSVFGLNSRRKLQASLAKMEEKDENGGDGRAALPKLPQQPEGRARAKVLRAQLAGEERESLGSSETSSSEQEDLPTVEAWIEARRKFRAELEGLRNVEKWLSGKPSLSRQERGCLERIKARRADRKAAAAAAAAAETQDSPPPKSSQPQKKARVPRLCAPYPEALVTLHNLLHKKKLELVDVFKAAGMDRRKIKRADFIKVIKETEVPISDKELEDIIIFLSSSKPGNFISLQDLIDCQKQWLEMRKGQSQEAKTGVKAQFQKAPCKTATSPPSPGGRAEGLKPPAPPKPERKLIGLELPPINTEPERRHLNFEEMEEAGKHERERKRLEKNTDSPIEWKEKCRLVRSGDAAVDEHCLPSTMEPALGELVDRYRRSAVVTYTDSSKMCKERGVHISETALQRGLLHPGDRIIKEGDDIRSIRQPGADNSTGRADAASPGSSSRPGAAEKRLFERGQDPSVGQRNLLRNKKEKSSDNMFWPGHLLDKLCLYFPEKQRNRAHPLFSCVQPAMPAYPGI